MNKYSAEACTLRLMKAEPTEPRQIKQLEAAIDERRLDGVSGTLVCDLKGCLAVMPDTQEQVSHFNNVRCALNERPNPPKRTTPPALEPDICPTPSIDDLQNMINNVPFEVSKGEHVLFAAVFAVKSLYKSVRQVLGGANAA